MFFIFRLVIVIAMYLIFYANVLLTNLVAIFNYYIVLHCYILVKLRNKQINRCSFVIDIKQLLMLYNYY
jgi:hypothetical protein